MSAFTRNFYSSIQQYSTLDLKRFDEGPHVLVKLAGVNSSSINTSEIDSFRQGVEITQEKYAIGTVKISAGTPGHIVRPVSIGINDLDLISTDSYIEIDYFNPVRYLKAQEPGSSLLNAITFPIITSDNNQAENYILNGIIEPLTIRPVISFFSIESPFESHAVRGTFMGGNSDIRKFSSDQILTVDYTPQRLTPPRPVMIMSGSNVANSGDYIQQYSYLNNRWFLDASEHLLSGSNVSSDSDVPLLGTGYVNPDVNKIDSFDDLKVYLEDIGITSATHGDDMVEAVKAMLGSTGNYVPPGKKSSTAGFVYDNISSVGTDSLAFGGMTY